MYLFKFLCIFFIFVFQIIFVFSIILFFIFMLIFANLQLFEFGYLFQCCDIYFVAIVDGFDCCFDNDDIGYEALGIDHLFCHFFHMILVEKTHRRFHLFNFLNQLLNIFPLLHSIFLLHLCDITKLILFF